MVCPTIPAKLSRPRLFDITPRERLFSLIDAGRPHPALWVDGPAGAGKTSLLASYIEARARRAWWYQVDAGDRDLAAFFYALRELPGLPDGNAALPLFSREYQADAAGFARRFFRGLYAALGQPAMLVFDNVHEAAAHPDFFTVLRAAVAEAPAGIQLVFISRWEPPAVFARLIAQRAVARLGWPELQLTADEAGAIAGLDAPPEAGRIARACGGWAAGLTLMLAGRGSKAVAGSGASREATFDFLATEILDASPADHRAFLLATWVLPRLTPALADRLTGRSDSDRRLDELFRQNYFIERLAGAEPSYQYHGLFRDFLATRARHHLGEAAFAQLLRRGAELLEADGAFAEAFGLLHQAGAVDDCRRLIVAHGDTLARTGRLQTLRAWIDGLPARLLQDEPWLAYWRASCDLGTDPAAARRRFAEAERGFAGRGDDLASIQAVSGVIDACYAEWSDFSVLDPWIARLVELLDRQPAFPDATDELRAVAAALVAMLYRQPTHPRLPELAARVHRLLPGDIAADDRVAGATYLLNCYNWIGETGRAREVIALITPHLAAPAVSPLRRAWWSLRLAYHHYIAGEPAATLAALDAAAAIAGEHGQPVAENIARLYAAFHHLSAGDPAAARQAVDAFERKVPANRCLDHAIARYQRGWIALLEGNLDAAIDGARQAVDLARQAGVPNVQGYFLLLVAHAVAAKGRPDEALALWETAYGATDSARFPLFAFTAQLVRADLALARGDDAAARQALHLALATGARHDYANNLFWLPATLSGLCARALDAGIETDYVCRLIRRRALAPPGPACSAWPWPVRLFTLGAFRVERYGEALRFSRKAQKRPMALLMALVALGGREVGASLLAETLWPDADGDAARAALGTALYRLRHLLDCDDAILLNDGKLTLNPRIIWIDSQAFAQLAGQLPADGALAAEHLFALYHGHFLEREDEQPWMLAPRSRFQTLFGHAVESIGQRLEQAGQAEQAGQVYERGIALDLLAEPLYRRLMACQAALGRPAQALETYRRCRQALSVVLGIQPAAATEALRHQLSDP